MTYKIMKISPEMNKLVINLKNKLKRNNINLSNPEITKILAKMLISYMNGNTPIIKIIKSKKRVRYIFDDSTINFI